MRLAFTSDYSPWSKVSGSTWFCLGIDPNAPVVRLTEEQIRARYPWDYRELTEKCRRRYSNFKVDKEYHQLRKSLANNPQFAHIRRLDPQNPKSPKKTFYSQAILRELDKAYKKKS